MFIFLIIIILHTSYVCHYKRNVTWSMMVERMVTEVNWEIDEGEPLQ